ncbi:MAG: iron-containing alcohol dehydrogenase [Lacrimispora sp.]|uniref:iron-containing alcohol dehydrogenase n=1 Tax=Lacrimispora sp. TaxID=2719234 RepID=UPI0039E5AD61
MARNFIVPKEIITGVGALTLAEERIKMLGTKALVVTDKIMVQLGNAGKVEEALQNQGIEFATYADIAGEPNDVMIKKGLEVFKQEKCDFLIAIGGGSPIDAMKAIALLAGNGGDIPDYAGKVISGSLPAMTAIPTTAGTGSEVTQFTVIIDTNNDSKLLLKGRSLMPDIAVIDPQFTMTAPPGITAATGLDALTHAIEAYTSRESQTLSDSFALSAVKRIFQFLPTAFRGGDCVEAREQMAIAALEAGIAFNNSSVTLVHGMSRPIGALFHVPHGISNAMILKECLTFALSGAEKQFGDLGRAIHVAKEEDSDQESGLRFLQEVEKLCKELKVPSMKEYGIDKEKYFEVIDKMARDAMESGSPQNTRRNVSQSDIEQLYKNNW